MKTPAILLATVFALASHVAYTQVTYTSPNNFQGNWDDLSIWQRAPASAVNAPASPGNPINPNASTIRVFGFIETSTNGLTVNVGNSSIIIYDTLFVNGNLTLGAAASMNIPTNGILVITGDLALQGSFILSNNGNVVVLGDVIINNGTIHTNTHLYTFGNTFTSGNGNINGCTGNTVCSPDGQMKSETILLTENPELYEFATTGGSLPIELLYFSIDPTIQSNILRWATAMEINFDRFELERAGVNLKFEIIGRIQGRGDRSVVHYSFTDHQPLDSVTFYRLKCIDSDDTYTYSEVQRNVRILANQFKVYPNPAQAAQALFIEYNNPDKALAELISIQGKRIASAYFNNQRAQIYIPHNTQSGIYLIKIHGKVAQKILIE